MKSSEALIEVTSQSAIDHVLKVNPRKIRHLLFRNSFDKLNTRQQELVRKGKDNGIPIQFDGRGDKMTEGLLALLSPFEYVQFKTLMVQLKSKSKSLLLVLDHLQDPQNFGALARTAEALGIDGILIPKDRSASVTGGVYNASVGAIESIPVVEVANITETLKRLKDSDYWIVGSSMGEKTKPLGETPTFERIALVMGTELSGLSPHVKETCDWLTHIPMVGQIDSLNVSAAGAILMYFFTHRTAG